MIDANGPEMSAPYRPESGAEASAPETQVLIHAHAQAQLQSWLELEVHQLGAGAYQGHCTHYSAGRTHLVHERQNRLIHKTGILPKNTCTISFALGSDPLKRFSHFVDPEPLTFLLPEQTEFDILVPGQVETLYICLEQDRLLAAVRTLNPRFWERPLRGLHGFNTPETGRLVKGLLGLFNPEVNAGLSARTQSLLLDSIALALNQATEVLNYDSLKYRARQRAVHRVKRARDFIDASLQAEQIPSMVELCAHTGCSARTLQYAFHEVMQMTPMVYLRILRLNRVRSALQNTASTDTRVTQVATRWGFFHLGEFARDYQRLFGERPSETLAGSDAAISLHFCANPIGTPPQNP
jgi:AraC family ethanolamine operon transcriptional activator